MIRALTQDWKNESHRVAAETALVIAGQPNDVLDEALRDVDDEDAKRLALVVSRFLFDPENKAISAMQDHERQIFHAAYDAHVVERASVMNLVVDSIASTRETRTCIERINEVRDMSIYMVNNRAFAEVDRRLRIAATFCSVVDVQKCDKCCDLIIHGRIWTTYHRVALFTLFVVFMSKVVDYVSTLF